MVLRRIFGPKEEKEAEGWRELHNEELYKLYSSPYTTRMIKSKENEICGSCSTHGRYEK
jgi:hypothetical protein